MHEHEPVIVVEHVSKVYGKLRAVDAISLQVTPGEIFGVLGPNGAGKTTLLEMLVGLRVPTSGTIRTLGFDPYHERTELVKHIGVQPQEASLFQNLRVEETLRLFASFHKNPMHVEEVIELLSLDEKRHALVKHLSGGQRQRLLIGVSLIANPQLLFLDEPTGSLDPTARRQLWHAVQKQRELGKTVIMTTHYMDEAEFLCDRVAIVRQGKVLAAGSPKDLIETHLPERILNFEVSRHIAPEQVNRLPGVYAATVVDKGSVFEVRCQTKSTDSALKALLSDPNLPNPTGIKVEQATLEDVFLRLTGNTTGR